MLPKNFYKKCEEKNILKHILYGDTDSIFITIPVKDADKLTSDDKWNIADGTANEINKIIKNYHNDYLLPKQNINPKYCNTSFKTEMVLDSIMFLDIKKNYAYKLVNKEGKIVDPPQIKYTGIPVVKSDATKMTQQILRKMIEDVILNENIKDESKLDEIIKIMNEFKKKFDEDVLNYEFNDIGIPGKWSKRDYIIFGMKLYNKIINEVVFNSGSAARFINCEFGDMNIFNGLDFDPNKCKGICIPYIYDRNIIKQKFEENKIFINSQKQWEVIFNKICNRIVDLSKNPRGI